MNRRGFLKIFSAAPTALTVPFMPTAVQTTIDISAATEKVGAVTAGIVRLVQLLNVTQIIDTSTSVPFKEFAINTGILHEEDAAENWYYYGLAAAWNRTFCGTLHGNANNRNPASPLNGLANIRLADIDRNLLTEAFKHQGIACENIDSLIEKIELAKSYDLQTVGDLHRSIGRKLLDYIPEILKDIESHSDKSRVKDSLWNINDAFKTLSADFPSVFEGMEEVVGQIAERYSAAKIMASDVVMPSRLSLSQRKAAKARKAALANAARKKRRFSVREEATVFGWRSFSIAWRKGEVEPTRVQFHNLRLRLCRPKNRADDPYRPKDIRVETKDSRHIILSTRDPLLTRHLRHCASGERALFPPQP